MKALAWFWAAVLALLLGGAAVLQVLGPLPRPAGLLEPAPGLPGRMLPRIAGDGRTPAAAYAVAAPATAGLHPIALVLDGIGLDEALSERAIRELPRAVTLAFSAYTPDGAAERLSGDARTAGHECLVSVPMEPAGRPFADEGTRALLTGADARANEDNLHWALSRVTGCVGATGASDGGEGARFADSGTAFDDMLQEIRGRGLLYLDPRPGARVPDDPGVRAADLVIDRQEDVNAPLTGGLVDERLAQLETLARERGGAIGIAGPPLPVLIGRIAAWSRGLAARGGVLVPVSHLFGATAAK